MGAFKLVYDIMFYWPKHLEIVNQGALSLAALSSSSRFWWYATDFYQ